MWHHKTLITTVNSYTQRLPGWSISLDASGIEHFTEVSYCLRHFFQLSGSLQPAKITLTLFSRVSWHGFPVIKWENSIMFEFFFTSLRHCQMNEKKINVKFHSVHRIRCTCSFNVLKITILNNSCPFLLIILRGFTNLYISNTFIIRSKVTSHWLIISSLWPTFILRSKVMSHWLIIQKYMNGVHPSNGLQDTSKITRLKYRSCWPSLCDTKVNVIRLTDVWPTTNISCFHNREAEKHFLRVSYILTSSPTLGHGPRRPKSWNESRHSKIPMVWIWMFSDTRLLRYKLLKNLHINIEHSVMGTQTKMRTWPRPGWL